jgi:hypothetical protein
MSLDEKLDLSIKSGELRRQGKIAEAEKVLKQAPLPSYLAEWAKEHMGKDFLIKGGWNLSEAEAEFGSGWLDDAERATARV